MRLEEALGDESVSALLKRGKLFSPSTSKVVPMHHPEAHLNPKY